MKKVLIVITTGFAPYGGLTTVMMNYFRNMDRSVLQVDFASTNEVDEESLTELHTHGARYFNLGDRKKNLPGYMFRLYKLIRREKYDVVHINGNSATMVFDLLPAYVCRIPVRIAHGHTTQSGYPIAHKTGYVISGLEAAGGNALVIHAGTKLNENGDIVTAGGRVLGVVGRCKCLPGAISKAYEAAKKISFTDMHMRSDIGQRALNALE